MTSGEKMLEIMKTPEWKEKAKELLKGYAAEIDERKRKTELIFSNTDYINWLINFTKESGSFADDDWLYFPEQIDSKDKDFVDNFNLFYSGIEKYATKNHIYPEYVEFGNFYRIKYNGVGFEIGMQAGQGSYFYCKTIEICDDLKFIDFNDIINNKKYENVDDINSNLKELSNLVKSLHSSGVPIESIITIFNETVKELKKNIKEEKDEILVKKK